MRLTHSGYELDTSLTLKGASTSEKQYPDISSESHYVCLQCECGHYLELNLKHPSQQCECGRSYEMTYGLLVKEPEHA